jgi:hypothetical protein
MKTKSILIFLCLAAFMASSCSIKIHNYYSGFVYDELGRPVLDVFVRENLVKEYAHTVETMNYKNQALMTTKENAVPRGTTLY